MDPKIEEAKIQGNSCLKDGKYIEAMLHFTRCIKTYPSDAMMYHNRAIAFQKIQQYYYALQDADSVIRLMPKWIKGYIHKGEILQEAEHYLEAVQVYEKGLSVYSNDSGLQEGLAKSTRAWKLQRRSEDRLPWYGISFGILVGILLVVFDESLSSKPIFQNDTLRAFIVVALIAICYGIGRLYRYFVISQRKSLLEEPMDLLGSDILGTGLSSST